MMRIVSKPLPAPIPILARPIAILAGRIAAVVLGCLLLTPDAWGDDWPQWMGPKRDNVWREDGILDRFPEGGPKVMWRAQIAGGYAGPAVSGGRVFVTDYVVGQGDSKDPNFDRKASSGTERVLCLDAASGEIRWKHEYPVTYTISYPAGPRCTPTVDGDRVYTLGAEGNLFCFNAEDGKVVWSRDLKADYRTKAAMWGYAGHPLIDGNRLICVVGKDVAHAAAFDKLTGAEIWSSGSAREQGYSPPTIIEAAGVRQLLLTRPDGIDGVDPETGKRYWTAPYTADYGSIIMAPVRSGDYLYIGGFRSRNLLLKLRSDKPDVEVVWQDKQKHGLSAVNVQPFHADGHLYGFHENGEMRCVAIPSGEIRWQGGGPLPGRPQDSATAFIVRHGDRYWLFTEAGDLVIASLSPEGYSEIDRSHLIAPTGTAYGREIVWSAPAYADRSVFIRNDKEIIRVSLAK